MKNVLGLAIALSLALVAALLNWKYLERKSQEMETVAFLTIADSARIRQGDTFLDNHFTAVEIPRPQVGELQKTAVLYDDLKTVVGMHALHNYEGGEIVLRQDLKTPQAELSISDDERVMWIPVDTNTFVPSLVAPGDFVSFIVPKKFDRLVVPPANDPSIDDGTGDPDNETAPQVVRENEIVGPFRILSLGGRLGSDAVFRAAGGGKTQENVMGIAVKIAGDELEPRAQKLFDRLQQSNFRQVGVLLHPRDKK
jgi:hypothetical protein